MFHPAGMIVSISIRTLALLSSFLLILSLGAGSTLQASVVINEFLASNGSVLADEDGHFEDWIELYNPSDAPISLEGWGLSDNFNIPTKWIFPPEVQIPAGGYLLIWASGKDRRTPGEPLHTNFSLSASGEEILLIRSNGTMADEVGPTPQTRDVSMGRRKDDPDVWVFFHQPTPGAVNAGPTGEWLQETVTFEPGSRVFTEPFSLSLAGFLPHQEIRYTVDGSIPTAESALFAEPLVIEQTTLIRARIFDPSGAAGEVRSAQYVRLHPDLAQFRATLPIVILDAHGTDLAELPLVGPEARTSGYFQLIQPGPDGRAKLHDKASLATRQGIRLRGSSSRFSPKSPFSVEFQDERGEDAFLPLLGMAADSDWVFYNGYELDRTYIRNSLIYNLSREMGQWAPQSRFVEVFFNRDGGELGPEDYFGVYAIIERIKQSPGRLDMPIVDRAAVPPEGPIEVMAEGGWTGGYIFKRDRKADDEFYWRTPYHETDPDHTPLVVSRPKLDNFDGGPYQDVDAAAQNSRQIAYLKAFVESFEASLWTEYQQGFSQRGYLQYIEEKSFVDYLLINAFSRDPDAIALSTFYHKPANQPIHAGPVWDYDRAMGAYDERSRPWDSWFEQEAAVPFFNYHWWFPMVRDPDFMQAFYDRWAELRESTFSDESLRAHIQALSGQISRSIQGTSSAASRDIARWPEVAPRGGVYLNEVNDLKAWVINRANWMDRRRRDGGLLPQAPELQILQGNTHYTHTIRFSPTSGGVIYFTTDGTDPRGPGGSIAGKPYGGAFTLSGSARITARVFDQGHWSTPASATVEIIPHLLHYWSFNQGTLHPDYSFVSGALQWIPASGSTALFDRGQDFSNSNGKLGQHVGSHLRLNQVIGSTLEFVVPTTGFFHPQISYETRRSGQGPGLQQISVSTDGNEFTPIKEVAISDGNPHLVRLDLSSLESASDNPNLRLRIQFAKGAGGDSGNNRIDNFAVEAFPLDNEWAHPLVHAPLPQQHLIAGQSEVSIDLYRHFTSLDGKGIHFSLEEDQAGVLDLQLQHNWLHLRALKSGNVSITIRADNGIHTPVPLTFTTRVEPAPFSLETGTYHFDAWSPDEPAGNFPANMVFLQASRSDPDLSSSMDTPYHIPAADAARVEDVAKPYAAESRSRINGLGSRGILFINTGRDRDLGAAVLALDTRYADEVRIYWDASTEIANSRVYALRLQYRTDLNAPFVDVTDANGHPIEILSSLNTGQNTRFGPVTLPADALHSDYVQLRWIYYYTGIRRSTESGARDAIRLDNIQVEADILSAHTYALWKLDTFNGQDRFDPSISGPLADPSGDSIPNLVRYAFGSTPGAELNENFPRIFSDEDQVMLRFGIIPEAIDIEYIVEISEDLVQWEPIYFSRLDLPNTLTDGLIHLPIHSTGEAYFLRVYIEQTEPQQITP